jgi:two-component system KDP operon response regulator KdpE
MATVLGGAGIAVAEAGTIAEALRRACVLPKPHVMVVELGLPDGHGTDLITKLRDDPATSDITIIVLSALVAQADRRAAEDAGASRFLSKPILPERLLRAVQDELRQRGS